MQRIVQLVAPREGEPARVAERPPRVPGQAADGLGRPMHQAELLLEEGTGEALAAGRVLELPELLPEPPPDRREPPPELGPRPQRLGDRRRLEGRDPHLVLG